MMQLNKVIFLRKHVMNDLNRNLLSAIHSEIVLEGQFLSNNFKKIRQK